MCNNDNREIAESIYKAGMTSIDEGKFFQAYKRFHECLEIDPDHKAANFEVFSELVNKYEFEAAVEYLVRAFKDCTETEEYEYGRYLNLLSMLVELDEDLRKIALDWKCSKADELGRLCSEKRFTEAKTCLEKESKLSNNRTYSRVLFPLIKACGARLSKDKAKMMILEEKREIRELVLSLEALKNKRGLDIAEYYMLQIANDILYIRENGYEPKVESYANSFLTALDSKDYENAFNASDGQQFFNDPYWIPVITLLKYLNSTIKKMNGEKTCEELFETAELYWNRGDFFKAFELYKRCFEIDPEHRGVARKLFIYCVSIKRFDLAKKYLISWKVPKDTEELHEYNTFLFLLNNITELSDELSSRAKSLQLCHLISTNRGEDKDSISIDTIRGRIFQKKFSYAISMMKELEKNSRLSDSEETLMKLLIEADLTKRARNNEMRELIANDDIDGFVQLLIKLDNLRGLSISESYSLRIAKDILEIRRTGIITEKRIGKSDSIYLAIKNKDYLEAFKLNRYHLNSYARGDEVFKAILEKMEEVYNTAIDNSKASMSRQIDSDVDLYTKGEILYKNGRYYEAFCLFRECLEVEPNHKRAAFQLFVQCCELDGFNKALKYFRIMRRDETDEEKKENAIYLFLLNEFLDLPEDLKADAKSICYSDNINGGSSMKIAYRKIYEHVMNKNYSRALIILIELTASRGYTPKDILLLKLMTRAFRKMTSVEDKMTNMYFQGDLTGILRKLDEIRDRSILSVREKTIGIIVQDIFTIQETGRIPSKKSRSNDSTVFAAIFARDYRRAYIINKKFLMSNQTGTDLLTRLIEDIMNLILEIKQQKLKEKTTLTQEEIISIEDMCGTGLIPDIVSQIKSGQDIEDALAMYNANDNEAYVVYLMMADYYFSIGEETLGEECLLKVEELSCYDGLLGTYYRYIETVCKPSKKFVLEPQETDDNQ